MMTFAAVQGQSNASGATQQAAAGSVAPSGAVPRMDVTYMYRCAFLLFSIIAVLPPPLPSSLRTK